MAKKVAKKPEVVVEPPAAPGPAGEASTETELAAPSPWGEEEAPEKEEASEPEEDEDGDEGGV